MKRMLINATQEEELRMAMVDGQRLFDLNIEGPASERKKANIYKGKITRIEPSLEAAFVDYGAERHGFLPLKEISSEYFVKQPEQGGKPSIKEVLNEGQDIVVQIDKEERGNKGAALTTYVSLAGRFIVLKPNKARSGGVSRRIVGADRDDARRSLNAIEIPKDMSVILRTAGIDRTAEELAWDLENLLDIWQRILNVVLQQTSPFLIYRESNAVSRALRDYLTNDIGEILIDDEATYKMAVEQVESFMPHNLKKVKHYSDPVPLFTRFQIESQIESAFAHTVTLPSGGSIVIDHTEALVSIDINSARATKGGDIEATALNTNLEAAEEIARQLRIRDLGGLVVIDFIDMGPQKNQREVENRLRESVRQDRARVQIGKITRFGLLEMSRQRLRPSIGESAYQTCPRCSGFGTIRSIESLALAILRIIGEEVRKERTAKVIAQLPVEVATYLLNEKRDWVQTLETSHDTQVVLVANSHLETPHYDIRRVRDDQAELPENAGVSYALVEADTTAEVPTSIEERKVAEQAAIGVVKPTTPAPMRKEPEGGGFWSWLTGLFSGDGDEKKKESGRRKGSQQQSRRSRGSRDRGRKRDDQRQQGRQQRGKKKPAQAKQQQDRRKQGKKPAQGGQQKQQAQKQAQQKPAAKQDEAREDGKRPSRNRRSRGGRRRRRSADRTPQDQQQDQQQGAAEQKSSPNPQGENKPVEKKAEQRPPRDDKSAKAESRPDTKKADVEREAKPQPAPEQKTDARDAKPKPTSEQQSTSEQKPKREAKPKPTSEQKPKREAKPKPTSEQNLEREAKPKPTPEQKPEREAKPKPTSEQKPEREAKPKPTSEQKPEREAKPSEQKPERAAKPKPAPKQKKDEPKPAAAKDGNGAPQAKPGGRLLPWEPQAADSAPAAKPERAAKPAAEKPADKPAADKPAADKPAADKSPADKPPADTRPAEGAPEQ